MAKKINGDPEGEAPVKKAPAKPENTYQTLQVERRKLEAELSGIDSRIRDSINAGDVAAMEALTARKAELPGLFVAASMAETKARNEIQNAEDAALLEKLAVAESNRDKLQAEYLTRKADVEAELAERLLELEEAKNTVGEVYATINASRAFGAAGDAAFRKSLATLAGV